MVSNVSPKNMSPSRVTKSPTITQRPEKHRCVTHAKSPRNLQNSRKPSWQICRVSTLAKSNASCASAKASLPMGRPSQCSTASCSFCSHNCLAGRVLAGLRGYSVGSETKDRWKAVEKVQEGMEKWLVNEFCLTRCCAYHYPICLGTVSTPIIAFQRPKRTKNGRQTDLKGLPY